MMRYYLNINNIISAFTLLIAYILLGMLSIKYVTMESGIAIAWLPNSLLLAFFLTKNIKEWSYYLPFLIAAELIADYPTFTIIQSLQFSFINLFETMIAAYLIKKLSGKQKINFVDTKYVLIFILIGLSVMPAISAIFGATVYATQIGTKTTFFEFWRIWFFGDSVGILLLTPILVLLKENYQSLKNYNLNIKNIAIAVLSLSLAIAVFSYNDMSYILPTTPLVFILFLLWVVYKQGLLPGMIFALLIASISIYYTSNGMGPFSIFEVKGTTVYLQEYIVLIVIITLFFGVLHEEVNTAHGKLEELNKTLEKRVQDKTNSLVEANKQLKQLATKDPLTNIFNRRMLDDYISLESVKTTRYKQELSLIMIDIDFFKKVNDKYGHQIGDKVIVEIVDIISKNIREVDIFGRWGGEEFIVLLPQTSLEEALIVAQNLREKVQNHSFEEVGKKTISLGVSKYNYEEDPSLFIKRADDALYLSKSKGRNRVESI